MDNDKQSSAAAIAAAAPKQWKVYDMNARGDLPRVHEVITKMFDDGREPLTKTYKLYADKDPEPAMPMNHALSFLSDDKFVVLDPEGRRVTPPPKVEGGTGGYELPETQTIANWDELSGAALYKRCKVIPGSDTIEPNTGKEDMIEFLVKWRRAQKGGAAGIADALQERIAEGGGDTIGGAADNSTLDSLFGNENPLLQSLKGQNSASVT